MIMLTIDGMTFINTAFGTGAFLKFSIEFAFILLPLKNALSQKTISNQQLFQPQVF
jgi:hypothetical protein